MDSKDLILAGRCASSHRRLCLELKFGFRFGALTLRPRSVMHLSRQQQALQICHRLKLTLIIVLIWVKDGRPLDRLVGRGRITMVVHRKRIIRNW